MPLDLEWLTLELNSKRYLICKFRKNFDDDILKKFCMHAKMQRPRVDGLLQSLYQINGLRSILKEHSCL